MVEGENNASTESEKNECDGNVSEICTKDECKENGDSGRLTCGDCKRKVHYRCTKLPLYALEVFRTKSRKYTCANCVDVDKDFAKLMADYDPEKSLEVEELTQALQDISIESEMAKNVNENLEVRNRKYRKLVNQEQKAKKFIKRP